MKKRITIEDVSTLSDSQKIRLAEIWTPEVYDLAIALICTDADKEIYEKLSFVIGGVQVLKNGSLLLHDIKQTPSLSEENPDDTMDLDPNSTTGLSPIVGQASILEASLKAPFVGEDDESEDEYAEIDESFVIETPTSFAKEDCLPLLDIGQMIHILSKYEFGNGDFYLTAAIGEIGCDIGKSDNYMNEHYENAELCDVLWELIKTLL